MTVALEYRLTLLTDAEPDAGLGGDSFDGSVPRDAEGKPFFPASHIKGLLREEVAKLGLALGIERLEETTFGRADSADDDPTVDLRNESLAKFTDAKLEGKTPEQRFTTRTAVDPKRGSAKNASLRVFEAIPVQTAFRGRVVLEGDGKSAEELAVRAGLLALSAVGGGRARGLGSCVVSIEKETRKPGQIAREIIKAPRFLRESKAERTFDRGKGIKGLRFFFKATAPVCCPTKPTVGNSIETGFGIPASALRGALISFVERKFGQDAASALYESKDFYAHPLLPCATLEEARDLTKAPTPVRVSLSRGVANLAVDGEELKAEEADGRSERAAFGDAKSYNPLKTQDGALLLAPNGEVSLWKERSIPKIISERCALNGVKANKTGRAFFQTISTAPLLYSGVVVGPAGWLDAIAKEIEADPNASFGACRSVLGSGELFAKPLDEKRAPWTFGKYANVVVLQSPVVLPKELLRSDRPANRAMEDFIKQEWSSLFEGSPQIEVEAVSTSFSALFGWNRSVERGRREALLVAEPGSIFQFKFVGDDAKNLDDKKRAEVCEVLKARGIVELVKRGLGDGIEYGCGAVAFCPGVATKLYVGASGKTETKGSSPNKLALFKECLDIKETCGKALPSPSQIAAVAGIAAQNRTEALNYLEGQTTRLKSVWDVWKNVKGNVKEWLSSSKYSKEDVAFAFKTLGDLVRAM